MTREKFISGAHLFSTVERIVIRITTADNDFEGDSLNLIVLINSLNGDPVSLSLRFWDTNAPAG